MKCTMYATYSRSRKGHNADSGAPWSFGACVVLCVPLRRWANAVSPGLDSRIAERLGW